MYTTPKKAPDSEPFFISTSTFNPDEESKKEKK